MPEFSGFEGQYVDEFRHEMVLIREDGKFECTLCGNILCRMTVAKSHIIRMHIISLVTLDILSNIVYIQN